MHLPARNIESFWRCNRNYNQKIQSKKLFMVKKGKKYHYLKALQIMQIKLTRKKQTQAHKTY